MASTNWEIGPGELKRRPFKRTRENAATFLVMILAFAGFVVALWKWLGLLQDGAIGRMFRGQIVAGDEVSGLVVASLAMIGLLLLLWTAPRWACTRRELAIDKSSVNLRGYFLNWLQWEWTEPLANYQGVMFVKMEVAGDKNSPPKTYFVPELHHADAGKCIRLCQNRYLNRQVTEGGGEFREKWEAYAEALGLPALEQPDKSGPLIRREAGTLDMSIAQQLRTGRLNGTWEEVPNAPKDLRVVEDNDAATIMIPNPVFASTKWVFAVVAVLGGAVCIVSLLGAALFFSKSPLPAALIGFIVSAIGLAGVGLTIIQLTAETHIKLAKNAVDVRWLNSQGSSLKARCASLTALEEIRLILNGKIVEDSSARVGKVSGSGMPGSNRLVFLGDRDLIDVTFPSRESAEWAYHYILTTAAGHKPPDPASPAKQR